MITIVKSLSNRLQKRQLRRGIHESYTLQYPTIPPGFPTNCGLPQLHAAVAGMQVVEIRVDLGGIGGTEIPS
jgi:hypothetical protein